MQDFSGWYRTILKNTFKEERLEDLRIDVERFADGVRKNFIKVVLDNIELIKLEDDE
jgi:hypothetical protein